MQNTKKRLHPDDDCGGCALAGRREFLGDAFTVVAAVLAAGVSPARAMAMSSRMQEVVGTAVGNSAKYSVPAADSVSIDRDNEVILVRNEGAVYAFSLACPHQNTALHWDDGGHRFTCPKHHSMYKPDGTFIEGRATRGMDRYAITQDGDQIVVDLDTLFQQDKDAAAWAAAVIRVS